MITTDFLSLKTVDRATADNCYAAILDAFSEQCNVEPEELWSKLVGFSSDGAAVMQGVRNGVAAKLLEQQPKLTSVHCTAHRLELAIQVAMKENKLFVILDKLLLDLYLFYHQSTLNRSLLRRTGEALSIKNCIPTPTGGTRWIAHTQRALQILITRAYGVIMQHLLEVSAFQIISIRIILTLIVLIYRQMSYCIRRLTLDQKVVSTLVKSQISLIS